MQESDKEIMDKIYIAQNYGKILNICSRVTRHNTGDGWMGILCAFGSEEGFWQSCTYKIIYSGSWKIEEDWKGKW